jgi:hypothetical protein
MSISGYLKYLNTKQNIHNMEVREKNNWKKL